MCAVFHYSWFSRLQQCGWNGAILYVTFWLDTHSRYQEHQACVQEFTQINYVECQIKHCSFSMHYISGVNKLILPHGYESRQEYSYISKWALAACSRIWRIPSVMNPPNLKCMLGHMSLSVLGWHFAPRPDTECRCAEFLFENQTLGIIKVLY